MSNRKATPPPNAIDAPGQRRLPLLLRRAWYSLNQAFRRRIAHLDLTPDQFTILRWLIEEESRGVTQRILANLMASDPNTITSVLNRMEEAGLIERRRHQSDRRANQIHILPAGRNRYAAARPIAAELQRQVLAVMPEDRRDDFLAQLDAVARACHAAARNPAPEPPPRRSIEHGTLGSPLRQSRS